MSKSSLLSSSIAKKYWMAITGLFLCLFLVGHLLGNLQLILNTGEEGRKAFNEYAYFMGHNIFIKIMSYLTYASILFHAVDGILLAVQNRKARPIKYAYSNPSANSSFSSRWMALLGSLILVFLVTHMANFWWKMKISEEIPLHTYKVESEQKLSEDDLYVYHTSGSGNQIPVDKERVEEKETSLYLKGSNLKLGEGYRDLHTVVMQFFKTESNPRALIYLIVYVGSMLVLGFHLWHGFASAFQSLGINHSKYNKLIKSTGYGFAVIVPLLFAIIPVIIFLN